jgi:hypothetical protein
LVIDHGKSRDLVELSTAIITGSMLILMKASMPGTSFRECMSCLGIGMAAR